MEVRILALNEFRVPRAARNKCPMEIWVPGREHALNEFRVPECYTLRMKYIKLPHIDLEEYYQFITFRTNDSLDDYLEKIYVSDQGNSQKQLSADSYLDSSKKGAYLYGDKIDIFKKTIFDKKS